MTLNEYQDLAQRTSPDGHDRLRARYPDGFDVDRSNHRDAGDI